MTISIVTLQPLVALVAGILILLIPRLLNVIVAVYLILIGVTGLWPHAAADAADRSLRIDHLPRHAAVDDELGAGDEAALRPHQERDQRGDVLRRADAPGGMERVVLRPRRCRPW